MNKLFLLLVLLSVSAVSTGQNGGRLAGKVTSSDSEPLPGVTISLTQDGRAARNAITDGNGIYVFSDVEGKGSLTFTHIGFKKVAITFSGPGIRDVVLENEGILIDSVVVTALGIQRKAKALSYSQQGVDANTLNETRSPNFLDAISGKVAGVQVIPAGLNTGSSGIIIRGNSSITGNNQPLFIVDGMPIDNEMNEGSIDYGNNAANLNPEDIQDMQVLKGPNAAALYGSRAANGVILITTKKGGNKLKVDFNSGIMFQTLTEFPEYQNAYGVGTSFYIDNVSGNTIPTGVRNYRSWGSPMMGQPYYAINGELKPYLPQPDNVKDFYTTATLATNTIGLETGNANNMLRFSYTNYYGSSVVKGFNINKKHSINLRVNNRISKNILFDTKINYIKDIVNNRQYGNNNGRNPANLYTHMARSTDLDELIPYKDPITGKEVGTHRNFSNPYWVINENPNQDVRDRIIASINPEVIIAPGIKFMGRAGADIFWWTGYEFNNIGSVIASNPDGFLRLFDQRQQNYNVEGLLNFNRNFGDFSLVANIGANQFGNNYERREQRINSLLQPGLINISNAKEYPINSQTRRQKKINSVYASASVGYKNFAFIDVTGRNDWSSTLPPEHNSYFYPSFGGSLVITDALDLKSSLLSFAKIRASYAVVGNDTDPYRLEQVFSLAGLLEGTPLAYPLTTLNNASLKPEKTASFEAGIDLRFFRNRLLLDATYYKSSTTNQILTAQLPSSSGYQTRIYNAGQIDNSGIELMVTGKIIDAKKLTWESSLNYSKNKSLVVSLIPGVPRFQLRNYSSYIYVFAEEGKPYGNLRGLGVARDEQGRMLLEDGGGLFMKNPDAEFGSSMPDWLAGWSNTVRYKGFDLRVLLDMKQGGIMYSGSYSRMLTNGVAAETLYGRDDYYKHTIIFGETGSEISGGAVWDAYYQDGTKNNRVQSPQSYEYVRPNFAEFVIFDASYLKLREIAFGYTIPSRLLAKKMVKSARFSLSGRNLAILHRNTPLGIDPEAVSTAGNGQGIENGALPPNAIYGFNIRLTF